MSKRHLEHFANVLDKKFNGECAEERDYNAVADELQRPLFCESRRYSGAKRPLNGTNCTCTGFITNENNGRGELIMIEYKSMDESDQEEIVSRETLILPMLFI